MNTREGKVPEPEYAVYRAGSPPSLGASWGSPAWDAADTLEVGCFHPASSEHRPRTLARMLYDDDALYGQFLVEDCYVLCRHMAYQGPVYKDACVEFFVKPRPGKGHMNFEMNCGGAMLLRYVEDPTRLPDGSFVRQTAVPEELGKQIRRQGSLECPILDELRDPVVWSLSFQIPVAVMEHYIGPLGSLAGQTWRANFNKCAEDNSHPHWATWSPIGDRLDFHQPERFGWLEFVS